LSIAVDADGNVIVTGSAWQAPLDFGCGSPATRNSLFLAKLDAAGRCVWSKGESNGYAQYLRVATDPSGHILWVGTASRPLAELGCEPPSADVSGLFVAKVGPSGACVWTKRPGQASAVALRIDRTGNTILSGTLDNWKWGAVGTIDLGCGALTALGSAEFVAKLDPSGTCMWSRMGVGGELTIDHCGRVVVNGRANDAFALACAARGYDARDGRVHREAGAIGGRAARRLRRSRERLTEGRRLTFSDLGKSIEDDLLDLLVGDVTADLLHHASPLLVAEPSPLENVVRHA
jgi:hypothetical protein